jgi:hypothetical protein
LGNFTKRFEIPRILSHRTGAALTWHGPGTAAKGHGVYPAQEINKTLISNILCLFQAQESLRVGRLCRNVPRNGCAANNKACGVSGHPQV